MTNLSRHSRHELTAALRQRYREGSRSDKARILDEFVALTGYHRKHAIRVLGRSEKGRVRRASRSVVYDTAVREAIGVLWEAADRICGKRLKALLPVLVPSLERHGHLARDETVRQRVLSASAATIDRLLRTRRLAGGKQRRRRQHPSIAQGIPIRKFGDWNAPKPGFAEVDLVAYCGDRLQGSFAHTFVLVDIATGWIECAPLLARDSAVVADALDRLRTTMPFELRGIVGSQPDWTPDSQRHSPLTSGSRDAQRMFHREVFRPGG